MAGRKKTKERRLMQESKLNDPQFWERLFLAIGIEGMSLSEFCKLENVEYTKVNWRLKRSQDLQDKYTQARTERANQNLERINELSEQVLVDPKNSNADKISYEMKRWQAQVLDRARFGEKVEQNVNMNIDLNSTYLDQLKDLMQNKPKIINESKNESKKIASDSQVIEMIE